MSSQATTQTNYIEAPVNIQLFQKLFDRIPEQQKQIQVSENLTLDFCKIMDYYDDQNDHHVEFLKYIVNHGSIYRDLVREGDLSEEVINKYALYGENNGLFFRGIIIDYFSDALECSEFVAFIKAIAIVPTAIETKELIEEFAVSAQLTSYDLTKYDTLVIGCAHGLHDRTIIDHNHGCKQDHGSNSFIMDWMGYGFNAEIIGFNGLNIEHWNSLYTRLNNHRFKSILDHTCALFDTGVVDEEHAASHGEKEKKLAEVCFFAQEHILIADGKIEYLGQDGNNCTISDYYFKSI